jgi:hypothetical protein
LVVQSKISQGCTGKCPDRRELRGSDMFALRECLQARHRLVAGREHNSDRALLASVCRVRARIFHSGLLIEPLPGNRVPPRNRSAALRLRVRQFFGESSWRQRRRRRRSTR